MGRGPLTEIGVCLLVALISLVFLVEALGLPPGTFEPLGSGPVPTWTAVVILVCCAIVIVRAVLDLVRNGGVATSLREEFTGGRPMGGVMMMGLTIAYVAVLETRAIGFGLLTTAYLTLLMLAMERFRLRILPIAVPLAAVAAFGSQYVFTHIFFVDLPV